MGSWRCSRSHASQTPRTRSCSAPPGPTADIFTDKKRPLRARRRRSRQSSPSRRDTRGSQARPTGTAARSIDPAAADAASRRRPLEAEEAPTPSSGMTSPGAARLDPEVRGRPTAHTTPRAMRRASSRSSTARNCARPTRSKRGGGRARIPRHGAVRRVSPRGLSARFVAVTEGAIIAAGQLRRSAAARKKDLPPSRRVAARRVGSTPRAIAAGSASRRSRRARRPVGARLLRRRAGSGAVPRLSRGPRTHFRLDLSFFVEGVQADGTAITSRLFSVEIARGCDAYRDVRAARVGDRRVFRVALAQAVALASGSLAQLARLGANRRSVFHRGCAHPHFQRLTRSTPDLPDRDDGGSLDVWLQRAAHDRFGHDATAA